MFAPTRVAIFGILGVALCLLAVWPAETQQVHTSLEQTIILFENGEWEQAIESLHHLLKTGGLLKPERSKARKYIGIGYILLKEEEKAVEVFKDLVRDDSDFDMVALAIGGAEPPGEAVRFFGQAVVEVRQEEIREREARLSQTSRRAAMLRSVVLPGLGQRYQGYSKRGYFMLGMTAASIAYATISEKSFQDAQDAYDSAAEGADFDRLHTDYTEKADRADLALGIVGAMWMLNVIDAASQGPNITGPPSGLGLAPARAGGLQVVYVTRF